MSEWFRRNCRPLPLVLGVAFLGGPAWTVNLQAAPPRFVGKDANPKPTAADLDQGEEPPVKLQYLVPTTWEKILKDVAEQSGSKLVADRVPKGTFSRRDKNEYTRDEALRIVNNEIEKLGFRAIAKGEYIVIVDLPSQRPTYERPTVSQPGVWEPNAKYAPVTQGGAATRQFDQVTRPREADAAPMQAQSATRPAAPSRPAQRSIQQANFEQEGATAVGPRSRTESLLLDESSAPGQLAPTTVVVYRARSQKAATLAKQVYKGFRDRAELLEEGRNGLPAFRVQAANTEAQRTPVEFALAIDEEKEELVIDARPAEAEGMLKLLRMLDQEPAETAPIRLVSTTKTACEVALQFDRQAGRIQAARAKLGLPRVDQFAQVNPNEAPPAGNGDMPADAQPPLGDVIGNLKGEVKVESVPDLGVLIFTGNEADVERVMQVVRELEKLSEQTAPQLELLFLQNVNSDALAELMTRVYESLTKFPGKGTQPRQSVAILSVTKPNAILIVAPTSDMAGIKSLAEELDSQVDPETEFQVFHLETAVATQVQTTITEFYANRTNLGPRVMVRADVRSNSLIVSARPNDLDEIAALIRKIDQSEQMSASQLKVFPLQNAVATELAAVLNLSIQSVLSPPSSQGASAIFGAGAGVGNAQVDEGFRAVRSQVLQFLAVDADGEKLLKSGILADIRITPDPRINALLVTAPQSSLTLIGELIKQLDKPANQVAEIKVFTLANADAQLMAQQLQTLFNVSTTGGAGGQQRQTGILVAGAEDASSGLIPLRFSVDTRTNSVIAIGGGDALRVVEAIMLRLDESDIRQRRNTIYRLKNSPSDSIAQAVTNFFTSQSNLASQDPNLVSSVEQLEREVIVVSEPVSNSLLISATPRYNDEIIRLIEKLDAAPQQVIIQALLVEVELNNTDEFGIELGFQDSILFNRSIIDPAGTFTTTTTTTENNVTVTQTNVLSQSSLPGYLFGNPATPLGNNTSPGVNPGRVGSQGLSNFSIGRTNGDLGYGGLVLSASSESVSFLLRALSENRQVRVLSRPQIRTLDNQQAQIVQGQEVPVVNGVTQSGIGVPTPTIERQEAGVILTVTPRISPDGQVVMSLRAEKSQYNLQSGVPVFTDASTGNTVTAPVKDMSTAVTTISVPSGQTVVMGGLITSRTDEVHRKVPILGDIPILGYAFRYDYLLNRRTELLIFLTPRIIWDDAESEHIKDVEMARVHFIEREAEEMHGPLRGVPAADGMIIGGPMPANQPMPWQGLPPGAATSPMPQTIPQPPEPMLIPAAPPAAPDSKAPLPLQDAQPTPQSPAPADDTLGNRAAKPPVNLVAAPGTRPGIQDSQVQPASATKPASRNSVVQTADWEALPAKSTTAADSTPKADPPASVRLGSTPKPTAPPPSEPPKEAGTAKVILGRKPWSSQKP